MCGARQLNLSAAWKPGWEFLGYSGEVFRAPGSFCLETGRWPDDLLGLSLATAFLSDPPLLSSPCDGASFPSWNH